MSETKNLGLFKHDNPATNTNRFDVDKAINQNLDKIDNAVGQDRERLDLLEASNTIYNYKGKADTLATIKSKTSKQGDVWYCIEDSTYYAYNGTDWIPVNLNLKLGVIDELQAKTIKVLQEVETPTPVTGTEINIKDSEEAKITELNINGNSKQETRSGKNKFKLPESATSNGITYTNNEDETFNINGTATAQATFKIIVPLEGSGFTVGESYVISSNQSIGDVRYYVHSCTASGTWVKTQLDFLDETTKVKAFKETDAEYISCNIVVPSGITINLTNVKIQIEEGETATDYEAYGVSPSPDYPSKIKSCGDNINLFDGVVETGGIDTTGVNTSNDDRWRSVNYIDVSKYSNVTLSFYDIEYVSAIGRYVLYDKNKSVISSTQITSLTTIIDTSNASYLRFWCLNNRASIDTKVKVSKGTMALGYNEGCISETIYNENLLKNTASTTTTNGITFTVRDNGSVKVDGTATVMTTLKVYGDYEVRNNNYIHGDVFISGCPSGGSASKYEVSFYLYKEGVMQGSTSFKDYGAGISVSIADDIDGICVLIRIQKGVTVSNLIFNPMIKKGIEKSNYIQHETQTYNIPTQQPFRAIGDVKDTFVKVNNEWYEKHYIKEFVLDGSETYTKSSSYADDTYFCGYLSSKLTDFSAGNSILNSHFKIGKYDKITDEECMANEAQLHIRLLASRLSENSSNGVKEWFANNNTIVNYVSTTPTLIKCTEEQSTILWDIEQNAKTYKNVTNIYSEDEVSPNVAITYKKDIETLFANTLVESGV